MEFDLIYENYAQTNEISPPDEDGYYAECEVHNAYEYKGIRKIPGKWGDVSLFPDEKEPEIGDEVYLVYVDYDTGDTFNRDYNCHDWQWVFTDKYKARELVDAIQSYYEDKDNFDPIDFYGVSISQYTWKGYFEHLNRVELLVFHLQGGVRCE